MLGVFGICLILSLVTGTRNEELKLTSYQIDIDNRLALASQTMSNDIIYKYFIKNPGKSLATSVMPLLCAVGELLSFSKQPEKNKLLEILNLNNELEVYKGLVSMADLVIVDIEKSGTPKYFGKAYADDDEPFCRKYTDLANSLSDETGVVNFDDPKKAAENINDEIIRQGLKGFDKLVSSSDIDKKGGLVYVSTIEIMASFKHYMDTEQLNVNFNSGNGKTVKLPGLTLKDMIGTAEIEEMDATVYELELAVPNLSFVVFYPNKPNGLAKLVKKLREPKLFNEAFERIKKKCLQVTLPVMDVRVKADVGESLRQVRNVSYIFDSEGRYFKGVQKKCFTYVSTILHESSLRLDEEKPALPPSKNDKCSSSYKTVEFSHPLVFFYISRTKKTLPIPVVSVLYNAM